MFAQHARSPCQLDGHPGQDWNASHESYDGGRNDGFVKASGPIAMRFWDKRDLPFTYSLVEHFPIGQRYFCSVLARPTPTAASSSPAPPRALIATNAARRSRPRPPTARSSTGSTPTTSTGRIYYQQISRAALIVPGVCTPARAQRADARSTSFLTDAAAGRLPAFTFLDPNYDTTSEENPQDIQVGEQFVAQVVNALLHAPTWKHTALFLTYDEHGGYYDHVPPPRAIKPDKIPPIPVPGQPTLPGAYDRYGFRVPLSWSRRGPAANYVSSVVQDHTSITAFIERKWNLPAMTFRDANAAPDDRLLRLPRAAFATPPALAAAPGAGPGSRSATPRGSPAAAAARASRPAGLVGSPDLEEVV